MTKRSDYFKTHRFYYGLYEDGETKAVLLFESMKNQNSFLREMSMTGKEYAIKISRFEATRYADKDNLPILRVDRQRNVHQVEV